VFREILAGLARCGSLDGYMFTTISTGRRAPPTPIAIRPRSRTMHWAKWR